MRIYVQQLEERVRQLTGDNERLLYQLNQMRASLGQPPLMAGGVPVPEGIATLPQAGAEPNGAGVQPGQDFAPGAAPQQLGSISASPNDQLVPPGGSEAGAPVDLSTLAGGMAGELVGPAPGTPGSEAAPWARR